MERYARILWCSLSSSQWSGVWLQSLHLLPDYLHGPAPQVEAGPEGFALAATGPERVYHIAAEPLWWDYAPNGTVMCTQVNYTM